MPNNHYFDDPEEGPSMETSHPRFQELATEDFYYDCTDDFGPFGSDDGSDTLSSLEEWYREGGEQEQVLEFLSDLLSGWGLGAPTDLVHGTEAARDAWLVEDQMHETYLLSECRARVAAAFGQLKISGAVHSTVKREALASIACQLWLNARARNAHPQWDHAEEERTKLLKMQAALSSI